MRRRGEIWLAHINPPHAEPLRIRVKAVGDVPKDSDLLLDRMRAIDNRRLVRGPLLRVTGSDMKRVVQALLELIGAV